MDGARSKQKLDTAMKRLGLKKSCMKKLEKFTAKLQETGKKPSRSAWKLVEKLLLSSYTLSEENIGYFRDKLIQGGCHVVVDPMEADTSPHGNLLV